MVKIVKLGRIYLILMLVITCNLPNLVCGFSDNTTVHTRLSAEMSVHKYKEKLRFEKSIKFSPKMIGEMAEKLISFCTAVCPGIKMDLATRFSKQLINITSKFKNSIENEESLYNGYEKAFSNCLLTRYLKKFGYGVVLPEPQINIFTIKRSGSNELIKSNQTWKLMNVTIFPLGTKRRENKANDDDDDDISEEYYTNLYEGEVEYDDEDFLYEFVDYYDSNELDLIEAHFISVYALREGNDINHINRLMRVFKLAVGLFYEQCPEFYKPYTIFWEKFIFSLHQLFEENIVNTYSIILYLHFKGFSDELNKCTSKSISEQLFANGFEIGKVFKIE